MNFILKLHRWLGCGDVLLQEWGGAILNFIVRCYVGWQFFKSGLTKIHDWNSTLALFRDEYHVPLLPPDLAAVMGAGGELTFPILLFLGLFSRPAALGLLFVNIMAVISYPALFEFDCPAAINDHKYWGLLLLVLICFGAGKISLDAWLKSRASVQSS